MIYDILLEGESSDLFVEDVEFVVSGRIRPLGLYVEHSVTTETILN